MKAVMKQKRLLMLGQMQLSMIEYLKHDWHSAFGHKRLCYSRATAGTFYLEPTLLHLINVPRAVTSGDADTRVYSQQRALTDMIVFDRPC